MTNPAASVETFKIKSEFQAAYRTAAERIVCSPEANAPIPARIDEAEQIIAELCQPLVAEHLCHDAAAEIFSRPTAPAGELEALRKQVAELQRTIKAQGEPECFFICQDEYEALKAALQISDPPSHVFERAPKIIGELRQQLGEARAAKYQTADVARCFGTYRTRPDENDGKEFFFHAIWHNEVAPGEGERVVEGWFVPCAIADMESDSPGALASARSRCRALQQALTAAEHEGKLAALRELAVSLATCDQESSAPVPAEEVRK